MHASKSQISSCRCDRELELNLEGNRTTMVQWILKSCCCFFNLKISNRNRINGFPDSMKWNRSLYIILWKLVWMKNCAPTYINISRSQFSSACLCSIFKWYMIPTIHHTHFGSFFRYLLYAFFYSLHVQCTYNFHNYGRSGVVYTFWIYCPEMETMRKGHSFMNS